MDPSEKTGGQGGDRRCQNNADQRQVPSEKGNPLLVQEPIEEGLLWRNQDWGWGEVGDASNLKVRQHCTLQQSTVLRSEACQTHFVSLVSWVFCFVFNSSTETTFQHRTVHN